MPRFNFTLKFHVAAHAYLAALNKYVSARFSLEFCLFSGEDTCISVTVAVETHNSSVPLQERHSFLQALQGATYYWPM